MPVRLKNRVVSAYVTTLGLTMIAVGLVLLTGGSRAERVFGAVIVSLAGAMALVYLRGGLELHEDAVLIRNNRACRLQWEEIVEFRADGTGHLLPWWKLWIEASDGRSHSADFVASLKLGNRESKVERLAQRLNDELSRRQARSTNLWWK